LSTGQLVQMLGAVLPLVLAQHVGPKYLPWLDCSHYGHTALSTTSLDARSMQRRATCASCSSLARIHLNNQQQKLMWVHAAHMNRLSCHKLRGVRGMTCIKIAQVWSSDCMRSCQKQQDSIPCDKLLLFCMQLRFAPDDCCGFARVVPKAQ